MKLKFLFALFLVFVIILSLFFGLLTDKSFYAREFASYAPDEVNHFENLSVNIIEFFQHKSALSSEFNEKETLHMYDVRNIINFLFIVFLFFLFMVIALLLFIRPTADEFTGLLLTSSLIGIVVVVLMTFLLANFYPSFIGFHKIFFSGNWQFQENSLLIRMFPLKFFYDFYKNIIKFSLITFLFLILYALLMRRWLSKN